MAEQNFDVIVAGGGFAGIYAAWSLARNGVSVALTDAAPQIGGNLLTREWNGYHLDNGTHNFDIRTREGENFYFDILGDDISVFEDQQWAATSDAHWTMGFEMPDFGLDRPDLCRKALSELNAIKSRGPFTLPEGATFADWLLAQFGPALAGAFAPMVRKTTAQNPQDISAGGRGSLGMYSRPKLGTDAEMIALKESDPFWNDRLGVSLSSGDMRFAGENVNKRFCYPAKNGTGGLAKAADRRLRELGVMILTKSPLLSAVDENDGISAQAGNHSLRAKHLFWSLPEVLISKVLPGAVGDAAQALIPSAMPVGTYFCAFEVQAGQIAGPDYLQDFSPDRLPTRYNKAGVYSGQIKPSGLTYVTAEIPCKPSDIASLGTSETEAACWSALKDSGFLKSAAKAHDATMWGHPVAYTLPRPGFEKGYADYREELAKFSTRISGIDYGYRGRLAFMRWFGSGSDNKVMSRI